MTEQAAFSGSYDAADAIFLLTPIGPAAAAALYVEPSEKEQLIQEGRRHYSEMISPEGPPAPAYMAIFEAAFARHGKRMGREIAGLVLALAARVDGPVTLCSLVRAGVPLGVLLQRGLRAIGRDCAHFGVSIIRGRGIDLAALAHVLTRRPAEGVVFVDGWTGKGAIADTLELALAGWPELRPRLVVLADPAGRAWLAAGHEDWLIPSGILGCTVSGLISRSILNERVVPAGGFHAAIHLKELAQHDVSRRFVDAIGKQMLAVLAGGAVSLAEPPDSVRQHADVVIDAVAARYGITDRNRIKPGIAEATRAVLRRVPERILVARGCGPDLDGLRYLARQASIAVDLLDATLVRYQAITVIADARQDTARSDRVRP